MAKSSSLTFHTLGNDAVALEDNEAEGLVLLGLLVNWSGNFVNLAKLLKIGYKIIIILSDFLTTHP